MTGPAKQTIRAALSAEITDAMKRRDRAATALYRSARSAIDNAEAIAPDAARRAGAIESSPLGIGRTEVSRRELSEHDMIAVVAAESAERTLAADQLADADPAAAAQLRHEAQLLVDLMDRVRSVE